MVQIFIYLFFIDSKFNKREYIKLIFNINLKR